MIITCIGEQRHRFIKIARQYPEKSCCIGQHIRSVSLHCLHLVGSNGRDLADTDWKIVIKDSDCCPHCALLLLP